MRDDVSQRGQDRSVVRTKDLERAHVPDVQAGHRQMVAESFIGTLLPSGPSMRLVW